jgi:hypothetical protein
MMSPQRAMSNEERRVHPGGLRTTFVEDLSPQGPIVAFDAALETVRRSTRALSRALAVDFPGVGQAADALKDALAFAASIADVTSLPASGEAKRQLADVRVVAESVLSLAPAKYLERYHVDAPQVPPSDDAAQCQAMPGCTAAFELSQFRMRLGSLRRALDRLRITVETTADDVKASIANVLALEVKALSPALNEASGDVQLLINALETSGCTHQRESRCVQLGAAQQKFREVVSRHRLDAELFTRAKTTTCNALARMMLANVSMMITLAVKPGAFAIGSGQRQLEGASPSDLSGPPGEAEA